MTRKLLSHVKKLSFVGAVIGIQFFPRQSDWVFRRLAVKMRTTFGRLHGTEDGFVSSEY